MISEYIKSTRKQRELTQESFAKALCEWLPGVSFTKNAICNWERGTQTPGYLFLLSVVTAYCDWRHDFALACLEMLQPEIWGEADMEESNANAELE